MRIFHHEQHIKHCKKSAILKLDTDQGLLVGHEACSQFLFNQVNELLGKPASLSSEAQNKLLAEVSPVFTDTQNEALLAMPEKEEVKKILFNSNLNVAPYSTKYTGMCLVTLYVMWSKQFTKGKC